MGLTTFVWRLDASENCCSTNFLALLKYYEPQPEAKKSSAAKVLLKTKRWPIGDWLKSWGPPGRKVARTLLRSPQMAIDWKISQSLSFCFENPFLFSCYISFFFFMLYGSRTWGIEINLLKRLKILQRVSSALDSLCQLSRPHSWLVMSSNPSSLKAALFVEAVSLCHRGFTTGTVDCSCWLFRLVVSWTFVSHQLSSMLSSLFLDPQVQGASLGSLGFHLFSLSKAAP